MKSEKNIKIFFAVFAFFVFCFSLFKNISYPLFWHDEGETIVMGQRILKFGYPKIYDGKNYLNLIELPDKSIGIKEPYDAYLGPAWGQFYYAAVSEKVASLLTNDIYLKTKIIRSLFALLGVLGLLVLVLTVIKTFESIDRKAVFIILFFIFESLSVPLILHLREVRYYPISLFFIIINLYFFSTIYLYHEKKLIHVFFFSLTLVFLFITFPQAYFIQIVFFLFFNLSQLLFKKKSIWAFLNNVPVLISVIIVFPLAVFFETFKISSSLSQFFNFGLETYFLNIKSIVIFFIEYDFLIPSLILKFILWKDRKDDYLLSTQRKLADLFFSFFVIYIFLISFMPYMFNRYYITIQPIFIASFIIDLIYLTKYVQKNHRFLLTFQIVLLITTFQILLRIPLLVNHAYEKFNRYQGPIDYIVEYIKKNSSNPEELIIATNYEEPSLMYYLKSKVIVGFTGYNLKEDKKIRPNVVIIRKNRPNFIDVLNDFLAKNNYKKISLPIVDYQVNNIPEVSLPLKHLFITPTNYNQNNQLEIYWLIK